MTDPRAEVGDTAWDARVAALPEVPPQPFRRVAVVAAHPDDETLGVGGFLHRLHATGAAITLVVASDGEAAFPSAGPVQRADLGRARRDELADSLRAQGIGGIRVYWLGLPDTALAEHGAELRVALAPLLADADLCLAPWPQDPHPDHAAAGTAALAAAPPGAHRVSYPVWMWHWQSPNTAAIPWEHAYRHSLDDEGRRRKRAGIAAFTSQLRPGPGGEPPILPDTVLAHFDRDAEVLFRHPPPESAPLSGFAGLYRRDPDPWGTADRWYERRKRAVVLAALPAERYATAVEPACGTGELTRLLASRCDRVLASDPVPAALARATEVTAGRSNVTLTAASLPDALPDGPVDLVVCSEILYYLGDDELAGTIDRAAAALRPGGDLAVVEWRHWAPEAPRDATATVRRIATHPALRPHTQHTDPDFLLTLWRRT